MMLIILGFVIFLVTVSIICNNTTYHGNNVFLHSTLICFFFGLGLFFAGAFNYGKEYAFKHPSENNYMWKIKYTKINDSTYIPSDTVCIKK